MTGRGEFAHHVKDALANYYDPIHLQRHPLAHLLGLQPGPGQTAGECLREFLRTAIDSFRPPASIPFGRPEWLGYRLLWLRYVQSREPAEVGRELGLSQASYYRRHQEALEAVVSTLWKTYQETLASPQGDDAPAPGGAAGEAARLARQSTSRPVDLCALIEGIVETALPLARQQGIELQSDIPASVPAVYADPGMLRQAILSILVEGIGSASAGSLRLTASERRREIIFRLQRSGATPVDVGDPATSTGLELARGVLAVYGGRLWVEQNPEKEQTLCFSVPVARPASILIVDDDPGTVELYQRYLPPGEYQVRTARSAEEMAEQLAQALPDLILLDVLMPQGDGWSILQRLKVMPETQAIPAVICSVLSQPDLALALGAARVLSKPIGEGELVATVRQLLAGSASQ